MKQKTKETKRERFIRVAEARTQKVLDALDSLSNCSARVSYDYSDPDVEQILSAIESKLQFVREKFTGVKRFSLSSTDDVLMDQKGDFPASNSAVDALDTQIQSAQARSAVHVEEEFNTTHGTLSRTEDTGGSNVNYHSRSVEPEV